VAFYVAGVTSTECSSGYGKNMQKIIKFDSLNPGLDVYYILDTVYELSLVGGYADDAAKAQKISHRFFRHLHELPIRSFYLSHRFFFKNTYRMEFSNAFFCV
jgi:hypothetical protein